MIHRILNFRTPGEVCKTPVKSLEKQIGDLIRRSYIEGHHSITLSLITLPLKQDEQVYWESTAIKMKQRTSAGAYFWEKDEDGVLVVTNQRIIFRSPSANLWIRNLPKIISIAIQYLAHLPVLAIWFDGLQKPIGFCIGDHEITFTISPRKFTFTFSEHDLRELLETRCKTRF